MDMLSLLNEVVTPGGAPAVANFYSSGYDNGVILFTRHALEKFEILKRHGFQISRRAVIGTVADPEVVDYSRLPLKVAQRGFDKEHVLRVVYRDVNGTKLVITFYPGRRSQYGKKS